LALGDVRFEERGRWIYVRISWAVSAAVVLAGCTGLATCCVQDLTLAACSTNSLPWCLSNERLPVGLGIGQCQRDFVLQAEPCVWFDDFPLWCSCLDCLALAFRLLDGESWTLCASWMTAFNTYLASSIRRVAFMTNPVNTHSYRLLNALHFLIRLIGEWLDGNGESFGQLLIPLCFNLRTHQSLCSIGDLDLRLSSNNGLSFRFAGVVSRD
jgi:hypothetical protein